MSKNATTTPASTSDRPKTDFVALLPELNAGLLLQKLNHLLSAVPEALMYAETSKPKAKVTLEVTFHRVKGAESMVNAQFTLAEIRPTQRGKKSETDTIDIALHVGIGGRLMLYPEHQPSLLERQDRSRD